MSKIENHGDKNTHKRGHKFDVEFYQVHRGDLEQMVSSRPFVGLRVIDQEVTALHSYRNTEGEELYLAVDTKCKDGFKLTYVGFTEPRHNRFIWNMTHSSIPDCLDDDVTPPQLILYNIDKFHTTTDLYLVESEADADAMEQAGFCATTHPEGMQGVTDDDIAMLSGWNIRIIPGNTPAERWRSARLANRLSVDPGNDVRILAMPYRRGQMTLQDYIQSVKAKSGMDILQESLREIVGKTFKWEDVLTEVVRKQSKITN